MRKGGNRGQGTRHGLRAPGRYFRARENSSMALGTPRRGRQKAEEVGKKGGFAKRGDTGNSRILDVKFP